jgi:hypothetical protein
LTKLISKETNPFKFNDFFWKLIAKNEGGKKTTIYLRNEGRITGSQMTSPNITKTRGFDNDSGLKNGEKGEHVQLNDLDESRRKPLKTSSNPSFGRNRSISLNRIVAESLDEERSDALDNTITMYYLIKLNNEKIHQEIKINSCNLDVEPKMVLHEFEAAELESLAKKSSLEETSEFTIYLNTDHLYSAIIYNIAMEFNLFFQSKMIVYLRYQDLICIFRLLSKVDFKAMEAAIICACRWGNIKFIKNYI